MAVEKEEGEERKEKQQRKRERARDLLYSERGARGEGRREGEKRNSSRPARSVPLPPLPCGEGGGRKSERVREGRQEGSVGGRVFGSGKRSGVH